MRGLNGVAIIHYLHLSVFFLQIVLKRHRDHSSATKVLPESLCIVSTNGPFQILHVGLRPVELLCDTGTNNGRPRRRGRPVQHESCNTHNIHVALFELHCRQTTLAHFQRDPDQHPAGEASPHLVSPILLGCTFVQCTKLEAKISFSDLPNNFMSLLETELRHRFRSRWKTFYAGDAGSLKSWAYTMLKPCASPESSGVGMAAFFEMSLQDVPP